jgi:PilZ domain
LRDTTARAWRFASLARAFLRVGVSQTAHSCTIAEEHVFRIMARSERRRSRRHPVENVKGTLHASASVRIMNLSLSGMAVEADAPLRVGKTYTVTLQAGEGSTLELAGSVVWCHLRETRTVDDGPARPIYSGGLSFGDTLTEYATRLLRFLEKSAVIDVHTRVCGRFTMLDECAVDLRTSHDFEVRTISASGLLLESEFTAPVGTIVDLEVPLGRETVHGSGRVAFVGETTVMEKRRLVQLGVEFMELESRSRAALKRFIATLLT